MRSDGDDRNHRFTGAIVPENSVGRRCLVFRVGLEDFFSIKATKRGVLVSIQTLMAGIGFEIGEGFANGLQSLLQALVFYERL